MTFDFKVEYINALLSVGKSAGAGLATIGLAGAGIGVGVVFGSLVFSLGRNPSEEARLFKYSMLGFALTEAVGLGLNKFYNLFNIYRLQLIFRIIKIETIINNFFRFIIQFFYNKIDTFLSKSSRYNFFLSPVINLFCLYIAFLQVLRHYARPEALSRLPGIIISIQLFLIIPLIFASQAYFLIYGQFLLIGGLQLLTWDVIGEVFAEQMLIAPMSTFAVRYNTTINRFFYRNMSIRAAAAALFFGKSGMTPTGKAAVFSAAATGFGILLNGKFTRDHEVAENNKSRDHEIAENNKFRAFQEHQAAQRVWDETPWYRRKGNRPAWEEPLSKKAN